MGSSPAFGQRTHFVGEVQNNTPATDICPAGRGYIADSTRQVNRNGGLAPQITRLGSRNLLRRPQAAGRLGQKR